MARKLIGTGVTDENGEVTITYTGTGAGQLNIVAESSTFQSETYDVLDCIYYDNMSTDTTANYYVNPSNNSMAYDSTNQMIKITGLGNNAIYVDIRSLTSSLIGNKVNIEVEVVLNGNDARLRVLKNGSTFVNTPYTNSDVPLKLENVDLTETADSYYIRLETRNTAIGDSIQFKNLKIYPI